MDWDNLEVLDHLKNLGREASDEMAGVKGRISQVCFEYGGNVQYQLVWPIQGGDGFTQWWVNVGRVSFD